MQTSELDGQEEQDHGHQRREAATRKVLVSYIVYDIAYDVVKSVVCADTTPLKIHGIS